MDAAQVLILSDTHLANAARLPARVLELAEHSDAIIHAGDVTALEVISVLQEFADVTAVCGNVDGLEVCDVLPVEATPTIAGVQFAILHDAGPRLERHERLAAQFPQADVIVYGHSHQPEVVHAGGQWFINPGSPTQRRAAPTHTVVWLEIERSQVISAEIVHLD